MAQPAVADVRVSCPACGGPIHPIAGRCKHCRADLVAARGGATGAAGTMIHIGAARAPGKAGAAPMIAPVASAPALRPGLPSPGPTPVTATAIAAPARGGWGKRWPLVVAAVAAVAILASIAVLVLGGDGKKPRPRRVLGPAPDRMQTDDLPTDPWARGSSTPDPANGQMLPPAAVPDVNPSRDDPPPPTHDPVDDDTLGGVAGGVVGGFADPDVVAPSDPERFLRAAVDVTCKRLAACWGDATATSMCEQGRTLLDTQRAAVSTLCPRVDATAAGQCLRQLATLPCPDQAATMDELASMAYGLDPCMRACER